VLKDDQVDFALWGGTESGGGASEMIASLDAVPVTSERLADGRMPPATIDDLVKHRILGVRSPPDIWPQWLYSVEYTGPAPVIAAFYDTNQLSYEAAACGLGVTLAVPLLANRYLEDGRLRPCAVAPAPPGWLTGCTTPSRRRAGIRIPGCSSIGCRPRRANPSSVFRALAGADSVKPPNIRCKGAPRAVRPSR
jgi:LysR family glycine cleavage system transcriptional activator